MGQVWQVTKSLERGGTRALMGDKSISEGGFRRVELRWLENLAPVCDGTHQKARWGSTGTRSATWAPKLSGAEISR